MTDFKIKFYNNTKKFICARNAIVFSAPFTTFSLAHFSIT